MVHACVCVGMIRLSSDVVLDFRLLQLQLWEFSHHLVTIASKIDAANIKILPF